MDALDTRHGTSAGAQQHAKDHEPACQPCADAAHRSRKSRMLDAHRGNPRMVTLGAEAHAILKRTPRNQLHQQTGIRVDKITRYINGGPNMRVHRTTRDRILTAGNYWTPLGIQRRLRALAVIGYSARSLVPETGLTIDALVKIRRRADAPDFVRDNVARAIIAAYDRLHMTPATPGRSATRARNLAHANGWLPPLAWDCIDTQAATPAWLNVRDRRTGSRWAS